MSKKIERIGFEEALNATGYGKFNYLMLMLCSSLVMSMVFEGLSISFLIAASACELQTTSTQQGLAAGFPIFGVIATSHVWGYLADTKGRRSILMLSMTMSFFAGIASAFSPNWIVLCCLKLLSCSGISGTFALSMTMLSECTPSFRRSKLIILSSSIFTLSNGFMALLAIPILPLEFSYYIGVLNIHFNSWRLLSLIYTMPIIICMVGVYFSVESPKYLVSVGRDEEALEVLKTMFVINNSKTRDDYWVKSVFLDEEMSEQKSLGLWSSIKNQTVPLLKPPLLKNTIVLSIMFLGIYMCVNPYMIWLPTVADAFMRSVERGESGLTFCQMISSAQNITKIDEEIDNPCVLNTTAMVIIMLISTLFGLLNSVMSTVVAKLGRRRILIGVQFITGLMGLLINFSHNSVLSLVMFIVYLSPLLDIGLITTFTVDVYPTQLRAMAVCLTLMVGRGSAIAGINILKYMLVNNCEASFYLFSAITIGCGVIAFLLPADIKEEKLKREED